MKHLSIKIFIFVFVVFMFFHFTVLSTNKLNIKNEATPTRINNTKIVKISLSEIQLAFEKMKGVNWDVNKTLIWGYYFYDNDKGKLEIFSKRLQEKGFQTYEIRKSASNSNGSYLLYVFEKTTHTPNSLLEQCNIFAKLASDNNIEEFDGWEAGKKPL